MCLQFWFRVIMPRSKIGADKMPKPERVNGGPICSKKQIPVRPWTSVNRIRGLAMRTLDFVENETLRRDLPPFKVGDTVRLTVQRGTQVLAVNVVAGRIPSAFYPGGA